ncbi:MAG: transposase, partial [Coprothermobacterota bacterium]|nr:transposase [Coprothermobacterota bacterium]
MPRQARLDLPGLLQHVMVRGIEKRDIFLDDADREYFVLRLSRLLTETGAECLAWVLMPNHFHLLLRPKEQTLAFLMRRLLTGYAV